MLYVEMVARMFPNHAVGAWKKNYIVRLRSQTWKLKSIVEKIIALHDLSGFITLDFHFLDRFGDDSGKFRAFFSTDALSFEHFNVM